MFKQDTQANVLIHRRTAIKGLAGLLLLACSSSCASPTSFTTTTPTPTATSRPSGSVIHVYRGHTDRVTTVAWSPDGRYIASGSLDKTVQIWNATTGEHSYTYHGHTGIVISVTWAPDGSRIASASQDQTVQVWDAMTGTPDFTYQGHTDVVDTVAWAPDGNHIASGSRDQTVQIWSTTPDTKSYIYRGHVNTVTTLAWSPDSSLIASGSLDKTAQVWKAATGARLYTYRGYNEAGASSNPAKGVLPNFILALAWSHHGKRIAAVTQQYCSDECGTALFWDGTTGRNVSFYATTPVFALAWSPDDTCVVTATSSTLVQVSQVS